ncbi:MAG: alpha/beta hydrolase [Burkholderiales bacterium]|nr:alpha/beta hydrolase [Burkholderiales bacterium]
MQRIVAVGLSGMALWLGLVCAVAAEPKIGVVVMHGKWGNPGQLSGFANSMEASGYLTANIEMPWSGRRAYDTGADGFVVEIDAAILALKDKGATKIVLIGHSLGAAGGLHYVTRKPADGFIAIAPGHAPEGERLATMFAASVAKAKAMVAKGEGDEKSGFDDFNTGNRTKQIRMAAKVYLDFFDPNGPMNFTANVTKVLPGTHVLWVTPTGEEAGLKGLTVRAAASMPATVKFKKVEIEAEHMNAPERSVEVVLAWIRDNIKM